MSETLPAATDPEVFRVIVAGADMPPIVLYRNKTWSTLQIPQPAAESDTTLPARFARVPDADLDRCLAGKKYSEMNTEERRIYNRLRKRESDAKLADNVAIQARRRTVRRRALRSFYARLREEGRLAEYYKEQAAKNRLRRAARRQHESRARSK